MNLDLPFDATATSSTTSSRRSTRRSTRDFLARWTGVWSGSHAAATTCAPALPWADRPAGERGPCPPSARYSASSASSSAPTSGPGRERREPDVAREEEDQRRARHLRRAARPRARWRRPSRARHHLARGEQPEPDQEAPWNVPTIPGPAGIITPMTSTPRSVEASRSHVPEPEPLREHLHPPAVEPPVRGGEQDEESSTFGRAGTMRSPWMKASSHARGALGEARRERPEHRRRERTARRAIPVGDDQEGQRHQEHRAHDDAAGADDPEAGRAVRDGEQARHEQERGEEAVRHPLHHHRRERRRDPEVRALRHQVRTGELAQAEREDDERHQAHRRGRVELAERDLGDRLQQDPPPPGPGRGG